jgi:peptide deformylase
MRAAALLATVGRPAGRAAGASVQQQQRRCMSGVTLSNLPPPPAVLQLGDPLLNLPSVDCDFALQEHGSVPLQVVEAELHSALVEFRRVNGFGRAISAPQIGHNVRMIACNLGRNAVHRPDSQPFTLCNPTVMWRDPNMFSLWDDCMSFPHLMVKVRRHASISLEYFDAEGRRHKWNTLRAQEAELLQHELDHLEGTLSVDRAINGKADVVPRADYLAEQARYDAMVDYVIVPTL